MATNRTHPRPALAVVVVVIHAPFATSPWVTVNANQLPPSGSSNFHPHLQGSANPEPTTLQRLLDDRGPAAVREYLELERQEGERLISSTARLAWLAAFAPVGPDCSGKR